LPPGRITHPFSPPPGRSILPCRTVVCRRLGFTIARGTAADGSYNLHFVPQSCALGLDGCLAHRHATVVDVTLNDRKIPHRHLSYKPSARVISFSVTSLGLRERLRCGHRIWGLARSPIVAARLRCDRCAKATAAGRLDNHKIDIYHLPPRAIRSRCPAPPSHLRFTRVIRRTRFRNHNLAHQLRVALRRLATNTWHRNFPTARHLTLVEVCASRGAPNFSQLVVPASAVPYFRRVAFATHGSHRVIGARISVGRAARF